MTSFNAIVGRDDLPSYYAHESAYQKIREKGLRSWNEKDGMEAVEECTKRFIREVMGKGWFEGDTKRVLELGCGTGVLLKWMMDEFGFLGGMGVDVSETAIEMAKEMYEDKNGLGFLCEDLVGLGERGVGKGVFDVVVDGHCLHCLTDDCARGGFWKEMSGGLRKGGVGIVMTMARPLLRDKFEDVCGELIDEVTYNVVGDGEVYKGMVGKKAPMRYWGHWEDILMEMEEWGMKVMIYQLDRGYDKEPFSYLMAAGVKQ